MSDEDIKKNKILAVDDDPRNLRIIALTLEDEYEIFTATSGEEALKVAELVRPDLILLDIMMPGMSGLEVCRQIRLNPDLALTKVILVSGKAMVEERLKGYEAGGNDYLTKPFSAEELEAKIKVFLCLIQTEKQHREALKHVEIISGQLLLTQDTLVNASQLATIGQVTKGIAHQINNPLTLIYMFAEQLKNSIAQNRLDPNLLLEKVEKIRVTIERISKIITGIKNLARDGNQETYEKTTLNKIMDEVLQVWHCEGVRFEYKPCVAEVLLECRSAHIYQVMINLLNNARDAVSGLDEKWIALQVRDAGAAVEISITDSGHGIPAEIQDKIFLPFFTTKPTGKGSGLGLSIINKIVQAHQGTISIDKECPNTRFRILLPKTRSEAGEAAHE